MGRNASRSAWQPPPNTGNLGLAWRPRQAVGEKAVPSPVPVLPPSTETSTQDLNVWVPLDPGLQTRKGVIICRNQSSLSQARRWAPGKGWGERAHLMKSPSARAELPCPLRSWDGRSVLSSAGRRPGGLPRAPTSKLRERAGNASSAQAALRMDSRSRASAHYVEDRTHFYRTEVRLKNRGAESERGARGGSSE